MTGHPEVAGEARPVDSRGGRAERGGNEGGAAAAPAYCRPRLFHVGSVVEATRGSSSSGTSDANSQYYW
ncbi:hypothetical protein KDL01_06760 [Actinospica durhamensis]|uniref:Lasso RiPP family leader peptide-containing protein n=1 Tax=Actinospica durhamensis TaxID=1508375 RepID=A0A941EI17_9ACTN|nr:hypothetical protein [Actinospica durhamensis]MBR7832955.1 hypothetical protein [Actinospica durhamensis]